MFVCVVKLRERLQALLLVARSPVFALLLRAAQIAHAGAAMAETAALAGPYVETVVDVVTNFRKNRAHGRQQTAQPLDDSHQ